MITFLQAAYKVVEIPEHSCYDILKDLVIPFVSIILGFLTAVAVMKWQISGQKEIDNEKQIDEYQLIKRTYRLNVENLLIDLVQIKPKIIEELNILSTKGIKFLPSMADFNSPTLTLLTRIDYEVEFKAFISTKDDVKNFNSSFRTVIRIESQFNRINNAIKRYNEMYNKVMSLCSNINSELFRENALFRRDKLPYASEVSAVFDNHIGKVGNYNKNSQFEIANPENFQEMYKNLKKISELVLDDERGYEFYKRCNQGISEIDILDFACLELKESYDSFIEEFDNNVGFLASVIKGNTDFISKTTNK